jgi:hypothetical protein
MMAEPPVAYEIDAADRLTCVNSAWSAVAVAAGAAHLVESRVIGRSLWDFIGDATTRQLYAAILERARGGVPVAFDFRCDTPTRRRRLQMGITGRPAGGVGFDVRVVEAQDRPSVALLDPALEHGPGTVRMCGWCKRVPLPDGGWVEIEDATPVLAILDRVPPPAISHGMCPACYTAISSQLDREAIPS